MKVLYHSLLNEQDRENDRRRQENVQRTAHQIGPEIPERAARLASDSTDECRRDAHANRSGCEIVKRELHHLRQVRHRRLTRIALPVGVRGERRSGLEALAVSDRLQVLWIQRQRALKSEREIRDDHRDRAERDETGEIHGPMLIFLRIDPADAIDRTLEQAEEAPRSIVRAREIQPDRLGTDQPCRTQNHDRKPAPVCHVRSAPA